MKIEELRGEISVKEYVAGYVDFSTTLSRCEVCPNYNKGWACPAFDFDPMDIWNAHETLLVVGKKLTPEPGDDDRLMEVFWQAKLDLNEELLALEKEYPGSTSLGAGRCTFCEPCSKEEGLPCRKPDKMRYSIESLGGLVDDTAKDILHTELKWGKDGKMPEYLMLVGGLLS